jgi:hypothetical protein
VWHIDGCNKEQRPRKSQVVTHKWLLHRAEVKEESSGYTDGYYTEKRLRKIHIQCSVTQLVATQGRGQGRGKCGTKMVAT